MTHTLTRLLILAGLLLSLAACVDTAGIGKAEITNNVADWRDETIYQVLIDRFSNGDVNNDMNVRANSAAAYHGGDYQGLIERLDYLQNLGVTALWISPVVKNVESDAGVDGYHGYWTQNFLEVNPHFGDMAKLRELVRACHARGMKVILDIVTNHVGQLFYYDINRDGQPGELVIGSGTSSPITRISEWDPDFQENGIQAWTSLGYSGIAPITWIWSPEINRVPPWPPEFDNDDWYNRKGRVTVWGREKDACLQAGKITQVEHDSGAYWADLPGCWAYVRLQEEKGDFPGGLKDLKTELPEVQQAMIRAYSYWLEMADFDAFRIDTVKHVETSFWTAFAPGIRKTAQAVGKKNFFMYGEAFDGNDRLIGSYTKGAMLDSVFYFSQKFALDNVFKYNGGTKALEDLWKQRLPTLDQATLDQCCKGEASCPDAYKTCTTGAPNDLSVTCPVNWGFCGHEGGPTDENGALLRPYQMAVNFLDNHDLPRFLNDFSSSLPASLQPANESAKRRVLINALSLLYTMDGLPCLYYGTEQNFKGGNDPANREDLWASNFDTSNETFKAIKRLIALRKRYAPLRRGDLRVVWSSNRTAKVGADGRTASDQAEDAGILAFERSYNGETVLVVINTNPENSRDTDPQRSFTSFGGANMPTSFKSGDTLQNVNDDGDAIDNSVTVGAGGALRISLAPRTLKVFVKP